MATQNNSQTAPKVGGLTYADLDYLVNKRHIPYKWALDNCKSMDENEAGMVLRYPAKSAGIMFMSAEYGQWQYRPYTPWLSLDAKEGDDEPPKYRNPIHEHDLFLPQHPGNKAFWADLEALKPLCIQINGKPYIVITEGGIKGITGCANGIPTVSVCGVWMGLTAKAKGEPDLVPGLKRLAEAGFGFIIAFDSDTKPKTVKNVRMAEKRLAERLRAYGCDVLSVTGKWQPEEGKGMDDFINNNDIEAFRAILMQATPIAEPRDTGDKKGKQLPPPSKIAEELAEIYRDKLAWESEYQLWRQYGGKFDGLWNIETVETVRGLIHAHLRSQNLPFNAGFVSSVETTLKSDLEAKEWNEQPGLIPLRDGILDQKTKELKPHAPGYRFTSQLPHKWADSKIGCQPIEDFLLKVTGSQAIANVLLAFFSAVVTRRADLQRYLELIGGGGTGKSTVMALARALAGAENTASSQLKHLENNQFETAKFYGKSLAIFPDSERWQGEVSVLKKMTGQDPIRYERKGIQQSRDYIFGGMVILSANEPIESKDKTSGLGRRPLTIPFDIRVPEYKNRNLIKEFEPYIPGLLKRVLDISPEEITRLIGDTDEQVPELANKKWEQMLQTNDIARWLDDKAVIDPELITYVGTNDETKAGSWLYASYCVDRQEQNEKPLSMKAFRPNLMDFLLNQLKVQVETGEDRKGRFIKGLGLRCHLDPTGEIYPRPVTKKPFGGGGLMVVGGGCVVAETIGSGGWDGYGGLNEGSDKTDNTQSVTPPAPSHNQNCDRTGENNPQHPPNPPLPSTPAVTNPPQKPRNPSHPDTFANQHLASMLAEEMREILASGNVEAAKQLWNQLKNDNPQKRGFFWKAFNLEEKRKAQLLIFAGLTEGTSLKYVGSCEQYQGVALTAYDANGQGGVTCRKPDDTLTTWIPIKDLRKS
jgi:putative DNA primase/helicase